MGNVEESQQRLQAIEDLRSRKIEVLLRIIDELSGMDLSVPEIEVVLRTCGMNGECAIRFGASIKAEREKGRIHPDRPMHP